MGRLQCPRCGTLVEERPGETPVCPNCGFRGDAPPSEATPSPGAPPPLSPYSATPYGGGPAPEYGATAGYAAPAPTTQAPPGYDTRPTNSLAVASLVLSLVGLCIGLTAILGVIFGVVARKQCKERNEKGEGLALAGIIVGSIIIALWVLYVIFILVILSMEPVF